MNNETVLTETQTPSELDNPLKPNNDQPEIAILRQIKYENSTDKFKSVKMLEKIRKQAEFENHQLQKRIKLIKKEEQLVLDKIMAVMFHEQKLNNYRMEDEKFKSMYRSLKAKEQQQIEMRKQTVNELKKQSKQKKLEQCEKILTLKQENYKELFNFRLKASSQKKLAQNFQNPLKPKPVSFKQVFEKSARESHDRNLNQNLEKLANEEVERLTSIKRHNHSLLKQHLEAYECLMKERSFHKQYFTQFRNPLPTAKHP